MENADIFLIFSIDFNEEQEKLVEPNYLQLQKIASE